MKKYVLLFLAIAAFAFTSCSKDEEDVEKEKAQVVITLKPTDGKVKEDYYVFVFEKLDYIKKNNLEKAVKRVLSDKGQATFDFEIAKTKTYYFEVYKKISEDTFNPRSAEPKKIDVEKGVTKRADIIVE